MPVASCGPDFLDVRVGPGQLTAAWAPGVGWRAAPSHRSPGFQPGLQRCEVSQWGTGGRSWLAWKGWKTMLQVLLAGWVPERPLGLLPTPTLCGTRLGPCLLYP